MLNLRGLSPYPHFRCGSKTCVGFAHENVSNLSINQNPWASTDSLVIPLWFKDEGLRDATRVL